MSSKPIGNGLKKFTSLLRRATVTVEEIADGSEPVATPPPGARSARLGDPTRETSTNAQLDGAADEPWGGNR